MKRTVLNLLTCDGAIAVTFSEMLAPEQYETIRERIARIDDAAELRKCIVETAAQWGLTVIVDEA